MRRVLPAGLTLYLSDAHDPATGEAVCRAAQIPFLRVVEAVMFAGHAGGEEGACPGGS